MRATPVLPAASVKPGISPIVLWFCVAATYKITREIPAQILLYPGHVHSSSHSLDCILVTEKNMCQQLPGDHHNTDTRVCDGVLCSLRRLTVVAIWNMYRLYEVRVGYVVGGSWILMID